MEDLQKEADRLFVDIQRGDPSAIEKYLACDGAERERFLNLMDKRGDDGSNLLISAITNRKYDCAKIILKIFKAGVEKEQSSNILLARNNEGNDCLRILMLNSVNLVKPTVSVRDQQLTSDEHQREKEDIDDLFHLLLQFTDAIQQLVIGEDGPTGKEGPTGESQSLKQKEAAGEDGPKAEEENIGRNGAIFWAVKNELEDYAEKLLRVLPVDIQRQIIKQKEDCSVSDHSDKPDLYNLLMLSLRGPVHEPLVDTLIGIVCTHDDRAYKSEVVMCKDKPEVFSQSETCLRLAARNRNRKHLVHLFKECVPEDRQFKALLEVGPCGNSAMSLLLEDDDIKTLKELLGKRESVQSMRKTLYDPATRSSFMQLEMTQQAIDFFYKIKLFRYNFFIPKPSEQLSRPFAGILLHSFGDANSGEVKCANKLSKALLNIGWHKDSVKMLDQWYELFFSIKEIRGNCSFLLLYFTLDVQSYFVIDLIIDAILPSLPEFVPKVIIFDECPELSSYLSDEEDAHRLMDLLEKNNILLLIAALSGEVSPSQNFLPALAEQIEAADGKTSLQEMFTAAIEKVNSRYRKSESMESFTSHMESSFKRIVLRRYDGKENTCRICKGDIRSCSQRCMICSTCNKWYHLSCLNIDEGHLELSRSPGFNWLCETCRANKLNEMVM